MSLVFRMVRCLSVVFIVLLSACVKPAYIMDTEKSQPSVVKCSQFFNQLDTAIKHEGVQDVQASRVDGLPFLRANRFLASFADDDMNDAQFATWLEKMNALAVEGYSLEWKNLSEQGKRTVSYTSFSSFAKKLSYCSVVSVHHLKEMPNSKVSLKKTVHVSDDYQLWKRTLGLYPISAWAFLLGIHDWHQQTKQVFAQSLSKLEVKGKMYRYASKFVGASHIDDWQWDALNIPILSESVKQQLFEKFAPNLEVDVGQLDDEIGRVRRDDAVSIDVRHPVVYQKLSYTRFHGEILPQLNYIFWFPSRPKASALDMLAGSVDSIMWRVTLTPDGKPLLYDAIHSCGCYHMFFPTDKLSLLPQNKILDEGALVPQMAPNLKAGTKITLRIEQGTHYIQKIFLSDANRASDKPYMMLDYNELRALPHKNGFHSAFNHEGIMPHTERLEAYFFWPMGIAKPGSMRQWGHHATAFVGHRHFDDAHLLERYFILKE